ncbi:MAG: methyltransferase domain-containing protein, partial [Planctomycetota bacterium]
RRDVEVLFQAPANARFCLADALRLPFPRESFSTVVALNLIDRVADPVRALEELARVIAPGGVLVVGSPYTWLEGFTPRARWLGGKEARGPDVVRARLGARFTLEREAQLPFFIAHHARSGQLGAAHVQRFRRNA